jgi:hypothetical protein
MRFFGNIITFWIIANTCAAESLECHIKDVGRLSDDKLSIVTETAFDRFEGTSFFIDLITGTVTNLGELDGHAWAKETYSPKPEMQQYFMRFVSITLPKTFAVMNIVPLDEDRLPAGELYFYLIVYDGGHFYTGSCLSSPNKSNNFAPSAPDALKRAGF